MGYIWMSKKSPQVVDEYLSEWITQIYGVDI